MADAKKSSEYRVAGLAVTYLEPTESTDAFGKPATIQVLKVGRSGETISLSDEQAARLKQVGEQHDPPVELIKPADSPLSYGEMTKDELEDAAAARGIDVSGTGANGAVLKEDLVNALSTFDQGRAA